MKKILFIALDEFSNINPSLEKQLQKHFPNLEIELLVLKSIFKRSYGIILLSIMAVLREYGVDFLRGRKSIFSLKKFIYHTSFSMNYFNGKIKRKLINNKYAFIFQTQSVFDSSNPHTPNFIYLDHTNLNNLNYKYIKPEEYLSSSRYLKLEHQIYTKATLLFVMSENIKDSLVKQYGISEDKIKMVYAGSNSKINKEVNQQKYASKNILFVGKDWERKGGPLLIEAFKIVQQSIPDAKLTILGSTPSSQLKNCTIHGDVPLEQVSKYYNQASVFCLPTKREPFGIVFIEAMLNRLPIVTNSVGATPELVINGENGYLLNNQVNEYAHALITLLNNPALCEQYGTKSYEIASQSYNWDNVGNLISQYIKEKITIQLPDGVA